jgi:hypothetical protein
LTAALVLNQATFIKPLPQNRIWGLLYPRLFAYKLQPGSMPKTLPWLFILFIFNFGDRKNLTLNRRDPWHLSIIIIIALMLLDYLGSGFQAHLILIHSNQHISSWIFSCSVLHHIGINITHVSLLRAIIITNVFK